MRNVVVGEVSALQNTICCWSATTTTTRTRLPDSDVLKTMMVADTRKEIKLDEDIAIFCHRDIIGKRIKMDEWVLLRNLFSSAFAKHNFFQEKIVPFDERWILYDNNKRPAQWINRDKSFKHCGKPQSNQKKVMLTVWWISIELVL
jgi:hypothetical protein